MTDRSAVIMESEKLIPINLTFFLVRILRSLATIAFWEAINDIIQKKDLYDKNAISLDKKIIEICAEFDNIFKLLHDFKNGFNSQTNESLLWSEFITEIKLHIGNHLTTALPFGDKFTPEFEENDVVLVERSDGSIREQICIKIIQILHKIAGNCIWAIHQSRNFQKYIDREKLVRISENEIEILLDYNETDVYEDLFGYIFKWLQFIKQVSIYTFSPGKPDLELAFNDLGTVIRSLTPGNNDFDEIMSRPHFRDIFTDTAFDTKTMYLMSNALDSPPPKKNQATEVKEEVYNAHSLNLGGEEGGDANTPQDVYTPVRGEVDTSPISQQPGTTGGASVSTPERGGRKPFYTERHAIFPIETFADFVLQALETPVNRLLNGEYDIVQCIPGTPMINLVRRVSKTKHVLYVTCQEHSKELQSVETRPFTLILFHNNRVIHGI